ncbi:copper resistance protein CopC [Streptomyces sp. NBC_00076]|uniref:copper resistance CopC family protein n=1 Tax=Streptomyces sp. NBC_00076 TaxID=2975642 RepID=UPI0032516857
MHVTERRAVRTTARTLVLPAALAALAVAAPQAAAHTELDTRSPGANSTLAGLPPSVTLTFSDAMAQKYAKVAVTGPDGKSAATGEPQASGKEVGLALDATSRPGRYTVGYRVVSADGHPVSGSYTFTLADPGRPGPSPRDSESAAAVTPRAGQTSEPDTGDAGSSGASAPVLVGAGVLAVAAVGAYAARRRRAGHGH